jgi:hypothetical protein
LILLRVGILFSVNTAGIEERGASLKSEFTPPSKLGVNSALRGHKFIGPSQPQGKFTVEGEETIKKFPRFSNLSIP